MRFSERHAALRDSSCYNCKRRQPVELSIIFLGCIALIISHCCAYKFGKYQGWLYAIHTDTLYGKEGMHLRAGETFLGVVDASKGPYFFITNARKDVSEA
jgi:hypothetical protein